ncbi:alpha/beta hydrolase [Streptomyces sp. WI03-4A]|uniref:alpha/beta hydrolase n=1 Tax=Streptomyces TaxID=1883 RepID=UPI0029A565C4|nr:alpha/beta hydrolase [Streptomyces sp. WI03-4A]MDX2593161.1 alpha/beta hydrolase [Streptomyces sp. WI03-4A]
MSVSRVPAAPLPLVYGDHPDQVADLFLPATGPQGPAPLVLFFHGGYWRAEHDRRHADGFARALAAHSGCAVVSAEYRRVGGGGGWPATFTDTAAAVDLLPGLAAEAAPGRVDPDRPVHAGHSAGGHLALWAALRHRLPEGAPGRTTAPAAIRGTLALAPTADLARAGELGSGRGAVAALLGGGPDEVPQRYAAADPAVLGAPAGRTVVVHGGRDDSLPVTMARRYAARSGATLHELPDCGHFDVIDPASPAWPAVTGALAAVLAAERAPAGR